MACNFPIILYLKQGMETLIQAEQLSRYYGPHCALDNLSFTLNQGQILGFLGPNGAGKSTTMQIICGNLAPTAGEVRISGIDMLEYPREAKAHLGYLPDTPPLYPDTTVDEYLNYCSRLRGVPSSKIKASVDNAKDRCSLGDVEKRLIGNLSKGYQQRVGIAQAIVHNPSVIVLDEPTVGLDPIQIREIRDLILELGRDHAILLSTHILSEVQATCTHVQIIHQGKLILSDRVDGLEDRMQASSLILVTCNAPEPELLEQVPGVVRVEPLQGNKFRIYFKSHQDPSEKLAETVVASGIGLLQLTPEQRSMEEVFVDLMQQADAEAA